HYTYNKTSATTALITLGAAEFGMEEINLTFQEADFAEGTWMEMDAGETFEGTLTFRIVGESKHTDDTGPGDDGKPPNTGSISFNTPSFISVQEKDEFVTYIIVSGVGGADLIFNLLPGADSFFFQLSPVTGKLSFRIPRDFDHPEDASLDNLYELTIEASDGKNSGFLELVVGILEMKEDPTDPGYPGGPGMGDLVFINPDFIEVEENMNYIVQIQASGLGGYSISYALNGGLDQKFFEIDPFTGDLRFFTPRDYEWAEDANQDNLYEVSIKASDGESSAVMDLVIGILEMPEDPTEPAVPGEVLLPIVYTNLNEISDAGEIHLSGRVLHNGGGKLEEVGFFISSRLRIDPMGPETVRLPVHTEPDFSWHLHESPFPKRLYVQAYAINQAGMNVGTIKRLKIPSPPILWWGKVEEREGGWLQSPWFGDFKYHDHGWLFHSSFHWLYASPDNGGSTWLWKKGMGWLWTGEGVWPYLWSYDSGNWIYLTASKSGSHSIYYDYSSSVYRNF
ncbi:MAG: cadherin repeat domain-containing protein, partial [Opitutales bacterium]|nr:cadherin repeat domain-containing protein [Opitutales bacterium]